MSSKARGLADLGNAFDDGALSNRNLIINGAMQVWQRGTSHSTNGYGSVDRWLQLNNTLLSRSTDVPTNEGFQYSSKIDFAGSADSNFQQNIENGIGLTSGKSVTLSFWAKATGGITRFENIFFLNSTNFGVITSPAVSIANSWQRYTLTVTVPSYSASQYSDVLQIRFDLDPTESGSYYITGVQLEVGDTATPFEHRSYGDELAKCQRYYEQIDHHTLYSYAAGNAAGVSGTFVYAPLFYSVKRAAPSITGNGDFVLYDGSDKTVSGVTFQHITPQAASFRLQSTGIVAGRAYKVQFHASGTRTIQINAEL